MWRCPKCGCEFKNQNQEHFCGEKPKTIDEYISIQPENVQQILYQVRDVIHAVIPEAFALEKEFRLFYYFIWPGDYSSKIINICISHFD